MSLGIGRVNLQSSLVFADSIAWTVFLQIDIAEIGMGLGKRRVYLDGFLLIIQSDVRLFKLEINV